MQRQLSLVALNSHLSSLRVYSQPQAKLSDFSQSQGWMQSTEYIGASSLLGLYARKQPMMEDINEYQ